MQAQAGISLLGIPVPVPGLVMVAVPGSAVAAVSVEGSEVPAM